MHRFEFRTIPGRLGATASGAIALALGGMLACTGAEGSSADAAVRDSAGVRIVENTEAAVARIAFAVADEPALRIGDRAGDPSHELASVQDATRLSDGRIVIALGGREQGLRWYDSTGTFLRASGGAGGGPGEFRSIHAIVRLAGDSLLAVDYNGRLSRFDPSGAFVASEERRTMAGGTTFFGPLADGSIAGSRRSSARSGDRIEVEHWMLRFTSETGPPDTIAGPLPSELVSIEGVIAPLRFSIWPMAAADGEVLHVTGGPAHEVRTHGADRSLRRITRVALAARPVTDEDIARERESRLSRTSPERRAEAIRAFELQPTADVFPAFSAVLVDAERRLWAKRYEVPGDTVSQWLVFDPDGVLLGSVIIPRGLTIFEIGADYILGRRSGEDDVPLVVLHRFEETEAS